MGRRIYKSLSTGGTSVFAYDGDNLIEETNSSGTVVARYEQTQNVDEPLAMLRSSATSYYNADGLGTVTSLANGSGTLTQSYTYDSRVAQPLTFRVAAPSWVSKWRRVWIFHLHDFVGQETTKKSKPRPFKPERVGHPERLNQFLRDDVFEWYHPIVHVRGPKDAKGWATRRQCSPSGSYTLQSDRQFRR
jgi:hypothetical protein